MYAATSILGALTVMLSPLMVSIGLFYKIYSITKAIVEGEKRRY